MESFLATKIGENKIELSNSKDLERLYKILMSDDNFILEWNEGEIRHSEVKISPNISAKVKTGEIILTAKEPFRIGGKRK